MPDFPLCIGVSLSPRRKRRRENLSDPVIEAPPKLHTPKKTQIQEGSTQVVIPLGGSVIRS